MEKAGDDRLNSLEFDIPDEDLTEYSEKDLLDIIQLTKQTLGHWKSMISQIPSDKEGLRMAVEASIRQSESDLALYESALAERQKEPLPKKQQNLN